MPLVRVACKRHSSQVEDPLLDGVKFLAWICNKLAQRTIRTSILDSGLQGSLQIVVYQPKSGQNSNLTHHLGFCDKQGRQAQSNTSAPSFSNDGRTITPYDHRQGMIGRIGTSSTQDDHLPQVAIIARLQPFIGAMNSHANSATDARRRPRGPSRPRRPPPTDSPREAMIVR